MRHRSSALIEPGDPLGPAVEVARRGEAEPCPEGELVVARRRLGCRDVEARRLIVLAGGGERVGPARELVGIV